MFDKKTLDEMVELQLKIREIFDKSDYGFLGVSEKNVHMAYIQNG